MTNMRELKSSVFSSFTYEWVYDVFLSFRGEDTRKGFTGNLYNALFGKGINTFIDDQELRKGEEITPALMMAIQQSRIAIVIFSENYASSTFCLEELTKIMKCIKHKGRLVWPVFYQVEPSDVRHQKGSYAKALANHERKKTIVKAKVKRWKLALQEASNLVGWHYKDGYEYKFIEKIIQEISEKINRRPLHVAKYPVGMHDMIEDMGREIVRLEAPSKPGKRSRLWFSTDILHVFKENKGSDKTEIIILNLLKDKEVQWDGNALKNMENLKILVIEKAHFSRGPNHLPKSLRVLKWYDYPESSLPAHYNPKKLVILDLSKGLFTFGNQMIMKFKYLTEMKLSGCQSLKQVPDMSGALNLKKLHLDSCKSLVEVHDSVGFLEKLEDLNLKHCTSLKILPHGIHLPSLKTMSLRNCTTLKNFPEILGKMENITCLVLSDSGICDLPFSIGLLVGLANLTIDRCNKLLELPSSIFMLPKLETLEAYCCKGLARIKKGEGQVTERIFSDVKNASSLLIQRDVDLSFCHLSYEFLATILPCLHYVTNLSLDYCSITILPSCISACHALKKLTMNYCMELQEIRDLPPNIKHIKAINCTSLTSQSKEMLLNQMLLNSGIEYIIFPGSTISSCFHQHTCEPPLSFRFCNKLPVMAIYVGVLGRPFLPQCIRYAFNLIIDGNRQIKTTLNVKWYENSLIDTDHIILLDLQLKAKLDSIGRQYFENGWTHAELLLGESREKYKNLIVREQINNMPDIQFINPKDPIGKENERPPVGIRDQMLLNAGIEYIIFPESTIPSCFHQHKSEPSLSFQFHVQLKANLDRIGRLHSENGWTRAEFQLVENGGKYMNLTIAHVREQIKNMPDIQFIDPKVPIKKTHTWDLEIAEKSQGLTLGYYHGDHMGI
ncbi:TMV resistance protein N [Trifolium repens]|nr:TMV resistance protein N [Trifolium repens]